MKDKKKLIFKILCLIGILLIFVGLLIYGIYPVVIGGPLTSLLGVILVATYVILYRKELRDSISVRSAKYGLNTFIFIGVVFLIVILVNVLGQTINYKVDTTEDKSNSLSEQSISILKNLENPVNIYGFIGNKNPVAKSQFRDLCYLYGYYSNNKVHCQTVNPDKNPGLAKQFFVSDLETETFGFTYGKDFTRAEFLQEEDFTSAIIRLVRGKKKRLCFTSGHSEGNLKESSSFQFNKLTVKLENLGYDVRSIFLPEMPKIPQECSVVVALSPKTPFLDSELDKLRAYSDDNGSILVLADPDTEPNLNPLLSEWGVKLDNTIIMDNLRKLNFPFQPLIIQYTNHPITTSKGKNTAAASVFKEAQSVSHTGVNVPNVTPQPLGFTTSGYSYGETDIQTFKQTNASTYDKSKDKPGPLVIGWALTKLKEANGKKEVDSRLVVFGDSDFVNNSAIDYFGNSTIILNAINWLAGDYDLISIDRPKTKANIISLDNRTRKLIYYLVILFLPFIIFLTGGVIWWRKRKS